MVRVRIISVRLRLRRKMSKVGGGRGADVLESEILGLNCTKQSVVIDQ